MHKNQLAFKYDLELY